MTIDIGGLSGEVDKDAIPMMAGFKWYISWSGRRFYIKAWYRGEASLAYKKAISELAGEFARS